MSKVNKHGLERYPNAAVKREIRQRCGFGCVICGIGIYDYEHADPVYEDAKEHDSNKMTLLCLQCHGKVTRGFWSKEKVKHAMQNPFCKSEGYSNEFFDFGINQPFLKFAGNTLSNCQIPIAVNGHPLFEILPPEEKGLSFRSSGSFYNSQGNDTLRIFNNEWLANSANWDVEVVGPTITIREGKGKIHLILKAVPPNGIVVERIDMYFQRIKFIGDQNSLQLNYDDGRVRSLRGGLISGYPIALSIGGYSNLPAGINI